MTFERKELPFQPFYLDKTSYQKEMKNAKQVHGEMYDRGLRERAIQKGSIEEAMIPVEQIRGQILLLGAIHDTCWDSAGAAKRIPARVQEFEGDAGVTPIFYEHATHMLYPDTVPFINFMTRMVFKEAKQYPLECKESRQAVSEEILRAV